MGRLPATRLFLSLIHICIVVNVHHYADQIEAFLCERHFFDWDIVISDEREKLLDTGGGLLKARELFSPGESVLIHNVDIFSDIAVSYTHLSIGLCPDSLGDIFEFYPVTGNPAVNTQIDR